VADHIGVVGTGVLGMRVARELCDRIEVESVPLLSGTPDRRFEIHSALGPKIHNEPSDPVDVVVLCTPGSHQVEQATRWLEAGKHVVSTALDGRSVTELLALDAVARRVERRLVVGAAMSPGLSTVLAHHAAALFESVISVHVGAVGSSGPACVEDLEACLATDGLDRRGSLWESAQARSGRELLWFAEPVGVAECQRGDFGDAHLIDRVVAGTRELTVRGSLDALERPRRLRWQRRESRDEKLGGLRVEVTGFGVNGSSTVVYGIIDRRSVASAAFAALAASLVGRSDAAAAPGAGGLSEWVEPRVVLAALAERGVKCAVFEAAG